MEGAENHAVEEEHFFEKALFHLRMERLKLEAGATAAFFFLSGILITVLILASLFADALTLCAQSAVTVCALFRGWRSYRALVSGEFLQ